MFDFSLSRLLLTIPAVIVALTFHEVAHGSMAYAFGDPTAKNAHRLSLNPLRHLDLMGTIMMIFFHFGWAKPVPVNPYYFQGDRKSKMTLVALAGPFSNIIMAFVAGILLGIMSSHIAVNGFTAYLFSFLREFLQINLVLAVFNLLPVPPLDGSKILAGFLPDSWEDKLYMLEKYGYLILLVLIFTGLLNKILNPFIYGLFDMIITFVNWLPFV